MPAQQCTDAKEQFLQVNGLDYVIIHADLVAPLFGSKVIPCGHKQNGNILVQTAYCFGKFETVNAGHHNVRYDQIRQAIIHGIIGFLCTQTADGL